MQDSTMKAFVSVETTANRLAIFIFLVTFLIALIICQPLFIVLRDQLIAFQISTISLPFGVPTSDDVILYPATNGFIENLKIT